MKTHYEQNGSPYQANAALACTFIVAAVMLGVGSLMAKPRPCGPPWVESTLFYEGFDQPYNMPTNQVIDPTVWAESWSGYCLDRSSSPIVPWVIPMVVTNRLQVDPANGAIRLWYRPAFDSGTGPGHTATLLTLASGSGGTSAVWWSFVVSPDGNTVSLACQNGSELVTCLSAPVAFQAGNWVLFAVGYGETNAAIFMNDAMIASGGGLPAVPAQVVPSTSLIVGSAVDGQQVAAGQLDELFVFSGSKMFRRMTGSPFGLDTQNSITDYYDAYSPIAALGPITPEEEAARRAQRMASRSMSLASSSPPVPGDGNNGGDSGGTYTPMGAWPYTDSELWLEIIAMTDCTGFFVVHPPAAEAASGVYDLFMTTNLSPNVPGLNLTNWLWLLRTDPGETNLTVPHLPWGQAWFQLAKTNDADGDGMSDAYEALISHTDPNKPDAPVIVSQPMSQTADWGDTVIFAVTAEGASPLSYQWLFGGTAITGETNSSLTLCNVQLPQNGDYTVQVTSPVGLSVLSSNATLTAMFPVYWPVVILTGPRQDYTFKNAVTYYVYSNVGLYGLTTIEGGAIIKLDWNCPDATLAVMGTLVCKTEDAYFPAFLTSVDDDTVGDSLGFDEGGPGTAGNGCPYLDLTCAQDRHPSLSNLRIRYADQGVTTPAAPKRVDIWDCQFLQCNSAAVAGQDGTAAFHNVLLADCGAAVAASTNYARIEGEHVTADVTSFWLGGQPGQISLTNSIVVGSFASGPALATDHTVINPAPSVFQAVGSGNYYLTSTSPYRRAGNAAVSARLLAEFKQKSTQAPVAFPAFSQLAGEMTLGPQAEHQRSAGLWLLLPRTGFHCGLADQLGDNHRPSGHRHRIPQGVFTHPGLGLLGI
jgi:hypothetical protein